MDNITPRIIKNPKIPINKCHVGLICKPISSQLPEGSSYISLDELNIPRPSSKLR